MNVIQIIYKSRDEKRKISIVIKMINNREFFSNNEETWQKKKDFKQYQNI